MDFGQFWRTNQRVRDAVLPTALILMGLVPFSGESFWLTVVLVAPLYWWRRCIGDAPTPKWSLQPPWCWPACN